MKNEINGYNWFYCPALAENMVELVESNITCAISDFEESYEKLTDEQITSFYESVQSILDDFEENGKVKDLQQFVGNFPVNHNFPERLKEQIENDNSEINSETLKAFKEYAFQYTRYEKEPVFSKIDKPDNLTFANFFNFKNSRIGFNHFGLTPNRTIFKYWLDNN